MLRKWKIVTKDCLPVRGIKHFPELSVIVDNVMALNKEVSNLVLLKYGYVFSLKYIQIRAFDIHTVDAKCEIMA